MIALLKMNKARGCFLHRGGETKAAVGQVTDPNLITRITIEPGKRCGRPCVRGLRIWAQILDERPDVEKDDFLSCAQFAAETGLKARVG